MYGDDQHNLLTHDDHHDDFSSLLAGFDNDDDWFNKHGEFLDCSGGDCENNFAAASSSLAHLYHDDHHDDHHKVATCPFSAAATEEQSCPLSGSVLDLDTNFHDLHHDHHLH